MTKAKNDSKNKTLLGPQFLQILPFYFCNGSNKSFSDRLTCSYWEHIKPHSEPHQSNPMSQSGLVVHGEAYTIHSTPPSSIIRLRNPMPCNFSPKCNSNHQFNYITVSFHQEYHIHLIPLDQVPSFLSCEGLA